ncbi:DUF4880 domain-containing protein [Bacillus subtilis subsp. subtilis]|nr:DUF4880 domain-containing protein [Bacillus subtilis subsp. subtilis]
MTGMNPLAPTAISPDLQQQAHDWLLRLQSAPVTQADADAFRRWRALDPRHAAAFAQARGLWAALGPALQASSAPPAVSATAASLPLPASVRHVRPRSRVNLTRRAFLGGAVAAAAGGWLVVRSPLGMWPELDALGADYRTATGEQRDLDIHGIAVAMGTRTTLRRIDGGAGIALGQGEAQFSVPAHGSAGVAIHVDGARVTPAAGARINVRCVGADVRVTCLAGAAVLVRGARTVALQPGWQARLGGDRIASVAQVATDRIDAWRQGWLVVDDQPLGEVVEEVNRYRPGRIVITGAALQARRVQARLPLRDLDTFIDLVRNVYGARVVNMPGGVVLLG